MDSEAPSTAAESKGAFDNKVAFTAPEKKDNSILTKTTAKATESLAACATDTMSEFLLRPLLHKLRIDTADLRVRLADQSLQSSKVLLDKNREIDHAFLLLWIGGFLGSGFKVSCKKTIRRKAQWRAWCSFLPGSVYSLPRLACTFATTRSSYIWWSVTVNREGDPSFDHVDQIIYTLVSASITGWAVLHTIDVGF